MATLNILNPVEVTTKTFTVKEIYEALAKNGLQHLRGTWYSTNSDDKTIGGCVLGQAAFNLGVPANTDFSGDNLVNFLNTLEVDPTSKWATVNNGITKENVGNKVGNAIITWNDAIRYTKAGVPEVDSRGNTKYVLRTYPRVVEMAHDLLAPHFEKTVKLPHYEYK